MGRVLIVYGTKEGQTQKIADFIGGELARCGFSYDIFDCAKIPPTVRPGDYDAVIVGGSVHMREYPKTLMKWVLLNTEELKSVPSAFFSVCLGVLEKDPTVQRDEIQIVENFFAKTAWRANDWAIFAGGLRFSQYNWFVKIIMKRIARKMDPQIDSGADHEYTHWNSVRDFTLKFIGRLGGGGGCVL